MLENVVSARVVWHTIAINCRRMRSSCFPTLSKKRAFNLSWIHDKLKRIHAFQKAHPESSKNRFLYWISLNTSLISLWNANSILFLSFILSLFFNIIFFCFSLSFHFLLFLVCLSFFLICFLIFSFVCFFFKFIFLSFYLFFSFSSFFFFC